MGAELSQCAISEQLLSRFYNLPPLSQHYSMAGVWAAGDSALSVVNAINSVMPSWFSARMH
jgi:hypothetical protein